MVFSLLIILFIGLIAFFHYVQGFFSATISAMICVLAGVLAISYDETVVNLLLKGKMADYAHGMVLCMIFAVVYVLLRLIFDKAIPGNVRTPSTVDKVGAGLMGLVAGIFCTGIFAIGVEMMPWDPSVSFMGAERYKVEEKKDVYVPMLQGQAKDSFVYEALSGNTLTPDKDNPLAVPAELHSLYVPVDDLVINTVYHLSDGGSLAGDKTLASVHPDYLTELFGERLGIQTSGRHTTLNLNGAQNIDIQSLFTVASLPCFDGQLTELRPSTFKPLYKMDKLPKVNKDDVQVETGVVKPALHHSILVVRVKVKGNATDDADDLYRFSTGAIHLAAPLVVDGKTTYKDFFPIGTLQNGSAVLLNSPDDFLFIKKDAGFDAVFVVDDQLLLQPNKNEIKIEPGASITVKRFADLDLSNADVSTTLTSDPDTNPIRNLVLMDRLKKVLPPPAPVAAVTASVDQKNTASPSAAASTGGGSPTVETPTPTGPQIQPGKPIADDISGSVDDSIKARGFTGVSTSADASKPDAPVAGGTVTFKDNNIAAATVDPTKSLTELGSADTSSTKFFCSADKKIVQIAMHPYQAGWDWVGQYSSIKINDTNGIAYGPNGCYQLVKTPASRGLFLRYNATSQNISVQSPDGTPDGDIYFVFEILPGTDIKSFSMGGKTQDLSSPLHVQ